MVEVQYRQLHKEEWENRTNKEKMKNVAKFCVWEDFVLFVLSFLLVLSYVSMDINPRHQKYGLLPDCSWTIIKNDVDYYLDYPSIERFDPDKVIEDFKSDEEYISMNSIWSNRVWKNLPCENSSQSLTSSMEIYHCCYLVRYHVDGLGLSSLLWYLK